MTRNAKLPPGRLEPSIEAMKPGEQGYTVPWAIVVDTDMNMWINGKYTFQTQPGGTVQLLVVRTEDGVKVSRRGLGRYSPTDKWSFPGGDPDRDRLPVIELI